MNEPDIKVEEIRHVARLRCTGNDLLILAEMARSHKTHEAHVPFWKVRMGEVEVEFALDRDRETSERNEKRKVRSEN